jgi:sugar phosphate isomerase/epimerase
MSVLHGPLGLQSYCLRDFKTPDAVIAGLEQCGVTAVELCGAHANFDDAADAARVCEAFNKAGIAILSIGVQYLSGDVDKERAYFEILRKAGAHYMSVTFPPGIAAAQLRAIEGLAEEYDVQLGIHNHGGYNWLGSSEILRYMFSITSPRIGLTLDTAWAMDAGEDPLKMVKEFGQRLYGLHLKDFVFDRARHPQDVEVGDGNLNLPALATALQAVNFTGFTVIEYEVDPQNPIPALQGCVRNINKAFGLTSH